MGGIVDKNSYNVVGGKLWYIFSLIETLNYELQKLYKNKNRIGKKREMEV